MRIILIDRLHIVGIGDNLGEAIDCANKTCGLETMGKITANDVVLYHPELVLNRDDGVVYASLISEKAAQALPGAEYIQLQYGKASMCFGLVVSMLATGYVTFKSVISR